MHGLSIETLLFAFMLTLLAGMATSIGAVLAFFSKSKNYTVLSIGMGFSAGVMIYVSFVEILAKSKNSFILLYSNEITGETLSVLCFFAGILFSAVIDRIIPDDVNPHETKSNSELLELKSENKNQMFNNSLLKRTGVFTALAIAIHNFPEGFATFVSALHNPSVGITIAFAIALHNIPEGMAVSLPIYHATGDKKSAFWYATLSGFAEPIGALVGFFLLFPFMGEATLGITFGLVAGIMIYISFDELLPAARVYGNAHTTIAGITLGMLVMALSLIGFKLV
ncbi:MAG: zinc transporter ZupT [Sulfurimonas sp. RIFOXYD12_FULL_33_39]|uniref:zinc transporter ZupT n=1 Tax=unclassified Sulfurimonas TaxID=2623549 RepID=UPI0008B7C4AF|nr:MULTISPECIES: zinc transporter ZupT [unclassified Sulfurimonas]OHE00898.1 MAG: zinc transporter ZupT [Sulfurimonas sp. RIFCSPLOWO2_12_FULL_34_6]OHE09455.1 MAG: zinc transporter ZupT [Sulfurimonas sp. RIFOXYD12_FULL_33_39]OHE12764.1 MAG: zinc transporter ZupT [Sulfurimonas sp. RIFOXYD2_FULL_34_21]DAB27511.1 MAG TPA: zinc transporter ZupT [Sulfurimonas sp. UBA10385]